MKNSNNIFDCIYQQTTTGIICIDGFEGKGVKMVVKGGRTDFMFFGLPYPDSASATDLIIF